MIISAMPHPAEPRQGRRFFSRLTDHLPRGLLRQGADCYRRSALNVIVKGTNSLR